jgi:hypothetical protein
VEARFELVTESSANPDFNGNAAVDAADYAVWRNNKGLSGATQSQGDANGDGMVDDADYSSWRTAFGTSPTGGSGGKYVRHLANATVAAERVPDGNLVYQPPLDPNGPEFAIIPTVGAEPIVLRGDIFAEGPALQRNTIGLRSLIGGSSANLIEMGFYNDAPTPPDPVTGSAANGMDGQSRAFAGFGVRVQLMTSLPGPNPNWQFFAFDPTWDANGNGLVTEAEVFTALGGPGWHRFEVTIAPDDDQEGHDITFSLDLLRDGKNNATNMPGPDSTFTITDTVGVTDVGFNSLRIGGPSALPTTLSASFDNIRLTGPRAPAPGLSAQVTVPEPASFHLLAYCSLVLLARAVGRQRA